MLWVACCLAYFRFLCCSKFTIQTQQSFDDAAHLGYEDISVDNMHYPQVISIQINQSKMDSFRKGVTFMLSKVNQPVCPVKIPPMKQTTPAYIIINLLITCTPTFVSSIPYATGLLHFYNTNTCI